MTNAELAKIVKEKLRGLADAEDIFAEGTVGLAVPFGDGAYTFAVSEHDLTSWEEYSPADAEDALDYAEENSIEADSSDANRLMDDLTAIAIKLEALQFEIG